MGGCYPRPASHCRRIAVAVCLAAIARAAVAADPPSEAPPTVNYAIVVTGAELLAGAYADSHTYFLTQTLHPLGLHCVGSMIVDDRREDILEALRFTAGRVPLVIVTGGLGPTDNDVTRQALAEFTRLPLREHPEVIAAMERRFGVPRDQLRENLRQQAQVPDPGTYLPNGNGTAVGLVFECDGGVTVALPGPPRELQPMVREGLVPYLKSRFGTHLPGCTVTLRFVGLGQSQIDQTLNAYVPLPVDVTTTSQFEGGRVDFTFGLPDDTPEGRAQLEELKRRILEQLGDFVYADRIETSLEQHVVSLLEARRETLALAEAGSGGDLAASLTALANCGGSLAGAFVGVGDESLRCLLGVSDEQWQRATTRRERSATLASAVSANTRSSWGIAVGEVEESDDSRFVEVVYKAPDGRLDPQRIGVSGSGRESRSRLTTVILDQLRRRLR